MSNKKGSLQLSINAIVVLILAITLLGLGLGFVKNLFTSSTDQFDVINTQLEAEIIKELEDSNELVSLKQAQFEVEAGAPQEFYFGIRNTNSNPKCYYPQFYCEDSRNGIGCGEAQGIDGTDGGNIWSWFKTYDSVQIEGSSTDAIYAELLPIGESDTYMGSLYIWKGDTECYDGIDNTRFNVNVPGGAAYIVDSFTLTLHDKKEFYITVI